MEEYVDYKGAQGRFGDESVVIWIGDGFISVHIYIKIWQSIHFKQYLLYRGYFQPLLTAE